MTAVANTPRTAREASVLLTGLNQDRAEAMRSTQSVAERIKGEVSGWDIEFTRTFWTSIRSWREIALTKGERRVFVTITLWRSDRSATGVIEERRISSSGLPFVSERSPLLRVMSPVVSRRCVRTFPCELANFDQKVLAALTEVAG